MVEMFHLMEATAGSQLPERLIGLLALLDLKLDG
jgi:hypothetical protein